MHYISGLINYFDVDFNYDEKTKNVTLTDEGVEKAEKYFKIDNLYNIKNNELVHYINQALKANYSMRNDVDYVVQDDAIVIGTNTYAGFLPFMYLNGGLEANEESYIYKNYGLKLKIVVQDDFQAGRAAFKNGDIDIIYCTADAFPVEMSEGSDMNDARFFNISNWSRGADAIVVNKNVHTVSDLVGKIVACSEGTASHTLLLNTLYATPKAAKSPSTTNCLSATTIQAMLRPLIG